MAETARAWRAHRAAPRSGGRALVLVLILAGLGAAAVSSAGVADAVVPVTRPLVGASTHPVVPRPARLARRADDLPTAIAVDSDGTSYVGFASASALVRISARGNLRHRVPLDLPGAVDGLAVTAAQEIWVDYGDSVSLLDRRGNLLRHFDHDPAVACDPAGHDPLRYGGIATHHQWVYVASRCDDTVQVYRRTGQLHATLQLPGHGAPRGIAYGVAQGGRGARLYVALPDRGQVVAFEARGLSDDSTPVERLTPARPRGGFRPEPGGLVADRGGQLVVSDLANQALYFYDTNHDYSLYRTLGHPPRPSRRAGSLNRPVALAQHARDGGPLSSNLFIADADNQRVQRWETGGYTYWARRVRP